MREVLRLAVVFVFATASIACGGDDDSGLLPGPGGSTGVNQPPPGSGDVRNDAATSDIEGPGDEGSTLEEVYATVFERCVVCHTQEPPDLRFDSGLRSRLVTASTQLPTMRYIEPGSPTESYLWHKVSGTQLQVDGLGLRMPMDGFFLDADEMGILRAWIEAGAPE